MASTLSPLLKLTYRAGLSLPEARVLMHLLEDKMAGRTETATADELASGRIPGIHREKVYTYLRRLSAKQLVELTEGTRPARYRVKGSLKDVVDRLQDLIEQSVQDERRKLEDDAIATKTVIEEVRKQVSDDGAQVEMDFYGVNMGPEQIHEKAIHFVSKMVSGDEMLACTPTALIWSVPEEELKSSPSAMRFRDTLAQKLLDDSIHARYLCYLDWYSTKPLQHRLRRLSTLKENMRKYQNLEIVDISPYVYISASPTLTIYGSEAVLVGLKGPSRKLEKAVVFTGKDVVNFFRDVFYTVYLAARLADIHGMKNSMSTLLGQRDEKLRRRTLRRIEELMKTRG